MNQNHEIIKIVVFGVVGYFVYQLLISIMPYAAFFIVMFVAAKIYLHNKYH